MPKQILKLDQFHGGLNSNSDPRDIAPNELSAVTDAAVDELGKLRMMGKNTAHGDAPANAAVINPGYGLFQFSHDRLEGETSGTAAAETGDDYLAMADTDTAADIDIYSRVAYGWGTSKIQIGNGSGTTGMKPCFYAVDGALRVSDGNFGAGNSNKWYGYIKQTHFNGTAPGGAADDYDGWYSKSLDLAAPTGGVYGPAVAFTDTTSADTATLIEYGSGGTDIFRYWANFDGEGYIAISTDGSAQARVITEASSDHDDLLTVSNGETGGWATEAIELYPPIGAGFNVYFDNSSDAGSWNRPTYYIGTTFIYQGGQESNVFDIYGGGNRSIGSDNILSVGGSALDVKIFATSPYDPFIIGGRVYIRTAEKDADWILLADISLRDGVRTDLSSDYTAWTLRTATGSGDAPSNIYLTVDLGSIEHMGLWTYQAINGYDPDESVDIGSVGEGFKTAVVTNRQVYVGNVKRTNEVGELEVQGDVMYKSAVNKFDVFPLANKIEASVRDGDEIVKLEEYADRILQFKKNKMHLINVSQDIEFLEDTFMHKGVSHPAAICKTDFGIAWVNKLGCYLYDGKQVINLLEKGGRQIIKDATTGASDSWEEFTANEPMIGYVPKKRQLIVVDDNTSTGTGKTFLYDMVTRSWIQGADATFTSANLTNFVTDWNGDLIHAHTDDAGTVLKWVDASSTSIGLSLVTKDIDFGQPGQRKKIYKVLITYKSGGTTNVQVDYDVDGGTAFPYDFEDGTNFTGTELDTASGWQVAELKPDTSSEANNIKSFRLRFATDGVVPAGFEINDISIVYRFKPVK